MAQTGNLLPYVQTNIANIIAVFDKNSNIPNSDSFLSPGDSDSDVDDQQIPAAEHPTETAHQEDTTQHQYLEVAWFQGPHHPNRDPPGPWTVPDGSWGLKNHCADGLGPRGGFRDAVPDSSRSHDPWGMDGLGGTKSINNKFSNHLQ